MNYFSKTALGRLGSLLSFKLILYTASLLLNPSKVAAQSPQVFVVFQEEEETATFKIVGGTPSEPLVVPSPGISLVAFFDPSRYLVQTLDAECLCEGVSVTFNLSQTEGKIYIHASAAAGVKLIHCVLGGGIAILVDISG